MRHSLTRTGILLAAMLGVLAGSGIYTARYAEGLSYLSDDPKACVNCHIMRDHYDGWQKASHHGFATCNDCHLPHDNFLHKLYIKSENGFWHSKGFTLQDFPEPIRIRPHNRVVLNNNCIHCHADLVRQITSHGTDTADAWNCIHCHGQVGHGPVR
jgi:cytochrome c nitrite reductase small subunit